MPNILTEGSRKAEFLVSEANNWRSREEVTVTVPANTTLASGTIMGAITASGKYVRHDSGAANGSETEGGVLFQPLVNDSDSAVDVQVVIVARDAEVTRGDLVFEDGADEAAETASIAALADLGIIVR
jgi:hypothetical protein